MGKIDWASIAKHRYLEVDVQAQRIRRLIAGRRYLVCAAGGDVGGLADLSSRNRLRQKARHVFQVYSSVLVRLRH